MKILLIKNILERKINLRIKNRLILYLGVEDLDYCFNIAGIVEN